MNKQLRSTLMLLVTSLIWGSGFVAQAVGAENMTSFSFNAIRYLIGVFVLIPFIIIRRRNYKKNTPEDKIEPVLNERLVKAGILAGVALYVATNLQQEGMKYVSVGKAGFITTLYIILVPISGIFLKKAVDLKVWIALLIALTGLYFLCINPLEGFYFGFGDVILILCAIMFTVQIQVIDHYAAGVDCVIMSCIEYFMVSVLSAIPMCWFESVRVENIVAAFPALLFAGVCSTGIAYTLQVIAQADLDPTLASMLMSLESAFSVLAGFLILGQVLKGREITGCLLMFGAVILSQLPLPKGKKAENVK